jgi:3-isopropylmalate/(R)-2-methylmalate dehydratase small subunit
MPAMEPFKEHTGLVVPLDRIDVDTDQLVPKQFILRGTREGYGRDLFYDWRYRDDGSPNPDFAFNFPRYQGATILLARENFGCGSSREHAAWAVRDYGFRAVIAPSFADIFYTNAFNNGVVLVTLPKAQVDELFKRCEEIEGYQLSVDLETMTITDDRQLRIPFELDAYRRNRMLKGLDDIGAILEADDRIAAFEQGSEVPAPAMYGPVDVKISQPSD